MGILSVSLFGCVRVIHDQGLSDVKLTHSTQGLLAYLILFRQRSHPREVLAEIFWGEKDADHAHQSLNTAIWQLRNLLEPSGVRRGTYLISDRPDEICFNQNSPFWLDVQVFDEAARLADSFRLAELNANLPVLENALALYQGDLLEGFYDDWVLREREILRARYLATLASLMEIHHTRDENEKSIFYGRKILELDPLREEIHRRLIKMYMDMGERAQAVRQYQLCKEVLARELSIDPLEETQALYRVVLSRQTGRLLLPQNNIPELSRAIDELHAAQANFDRAHQDLNHSIAALETLIKAQK